MTYTSSSSLDKSTQHFLHIMKGFCGHSFSRRLAIKSFDGLSLLWFLIFHVFGGDDNAFMIFWLQDDDDDDNGWLGWVLKLNLD